MSKMLHCRCRLIKGMQEHIQVNVHTAGPPDTLKYTKDHNIDKL